MPEDKFSLKVYDVNGDKRETLVTLSEDEIVINLKAIKEMRDENVKLKEST